MNKLVFIYLLSLIILNTYTKTCAELNTQAETPGETPGETPAETPGETPAETPGESSGGDRRLEGEQCTDPALETPQGYNCVKDNNNQCVLKSLCELENDTTKCENHKELTDKKCVKDGTKCKLVSTSTNSSNILNIFKITFILLFIFTIL